jgi:ParB-like chromosome segregation protein Spo0J
MATAKAATRKKPPVAKKIEEKNRFLFEKVEIVDINTLKPHPKNPRQGDVETVRESLRANGQYKPLVVNRHKGLVNVIAAGHHTWLAARAEGWNQIGVIFIDVDEAQHKRIMLVDNASADKGTYNEELLAEIMANLATTTEGLTGTGYTEVEFQDLIKSVQENADNLALQSQADLDDVMDSMPQMEVAKQKSAREQYKDNEDDELREANAARGVTKPVAPEQDDAEEIDDIEGNQEAELQAVLEVKVENFEFWKQSSDDFQIPELRDDYLLEKLPTPLQTWGGSEATPDDGKTWFLYNYSLGGLKGLPMDRSILCFYTYDERFEGWWETPAWYTARVLSKGIRVAVVPDFSFYYTTPRVMHLWNVYRAQWLGRFFQEAGMKVIPRLQFDYMDPNSLEIALRGIPRGCPVLATSQQNPEKPEHEKLIARHLQDALDEIKPKQLLYYSGNPGRRAMQQVKYKGETVYLMNYVGVRREVTFGKKEGLQGVKSKNRAKALEAARKKLGVGNQQAQDDEADE